MTRHGYDEVLAVRHSGAGSKLLQRVALPAPGRGERAPAYAPWARILPGPASTASALLEGPE